MEATSAQAAAVQNLLSRQEQDLLFTSATALTYLRGGEALFSEGQDAGFIYFIENGVIRTSRCAKNGRRQILAFRVSGDILGLSENGRYSSAAETIGPARVYRIQWQRMQHAMLNEPELQLHLLMKMADDYRQAEQRIVTLGQQNPYQRLISFILDVRRIPEFFDEKRSLLKLPMNRFDLADYLGTVTKSSERSFARLESEGLIRRITPRTIEIKDINGLRHLQCSLRRTHH